MGRGKPKRYRSIPEEVEIIIIIEGPDGAGKSTLVDQLSKELGLEVGERATKDRDKLYEVIRQDTYTALGEAVRAHDPARIWDRLFFSEMVYAPVVGRDCEFEHEEIIFVKRVLNAMGCPVIVCLPEWHTVKENVEGTHQMAGVEENLAHIYAAYGTVTSGMSWVIFYDYTDERKEAGFKSFDEVLTSCRHYLENHRAKRSW